VSRTLHRFIDELESRRRRLLVVNDDGDADDVTDIVDYFGRVALERVDVTAPEFPESFLVLTDGDDHLGSVGITELHDYLFTSFTSDGGRTPDAGARENPTIEGFLARLDGNVYSLSGEGKLAIAAISQLLETRAWRRGAGELHAGVQEFSTLRSEPSPMARYKKIADCGVDTSVYGRPDWTPGDWGGLAAYGDESGTQLGEFWFVAYRGPEQSDDGAVLAREVDDGRYTGFWTFDSETVDSLVATLVEAYQPSLASLSDPQS
jgi:hypothetical protein